MNVYYVSSFNHYGTKITTWHVSSLEMERDKLRRRLAGHTGVAVQEGPLTLALGQAVGVKRRAASAPRPQRGGQGA